MTNIAIAIKLIYLLFVHIIYICNCIKLCCIVFDYPLNYSVFD